MITLYPLTLGLFDLKRFAESTFCLNENCIILRETFKVRTMGQAMVYNKSIEEKGSLSKK